MIVRQGESQRLAIGSGTVAGINVYIYLPAAANGDAALVPADFLATLVTFKTTLTRGGKQYSVHNDNLLNLASFYSRKNAYERWWNGLNLIPGTSGTTQLKLRMVTLKFASPITVRQGDQLEIQVSSQNGCFSANINGSQAYLDFIPMPSTAHEMGIPMFNTYVVQTNANQQPFNCGDNVRSIQFINYDKSDFSAIVLSNIALSSSELQYSATYYEQLGSDQSKYPQNKPYRFGTTVENENLFMDIDWLPQSVDIFDADGKSLNQVNVNLTFNSANVSPSQNWLMYESVFIDPASARRSVNAIANDAKKRIAAIAACTGS